MVRPLRGEAGADVRGMRYVGRIDGPELAKVPDDAMLFVAFQHDGKPHWFRNGGEPIRARALKKVNVHAVHRVVSDGCYDDGVWMATAVGENAFK